MTEEPISIDVNVNHGVFKNNDVNLHYVLIAF